MTDDQLIRLLLLALLLILSAFFSSSETALMAIDRLRVKYFVQKKRRGADRLDATLAQPERLLGAILVGNNLVNIAASVVATGFFVHLYGDDGEWVTILVLTPVLLLFSEVIPKTYAARAAESLAFRVLTPIRAIMWVLTPVLWLMGGVTRLFTWMLHRKEVARPLISEDEIRALISVGEQSGTVGTEKRRMLHGVLELSETRVREVMVPRPEVVGIEVSSDFATVLKLVSEARHSRFPVYAGSLDQVVGVIHSKDILSFTSAPEHFDLRAICRPPFFVPESQRVEILLQTFRRKRFHMALVVDEYGGVEGLVTLEDIVEEIVGEIQDEFDLEELEVRELAPGRYLVEGGTSLRYLNRRFALALAEEHATTLAGFVLQLLGRIPEVGASVEDRGIRFVVRRLAGRRIDQIEMILPAATGESG